MYFLAIVSQDDLLRGRIVPSYILCKSNGESENRSPWRIYCANAGFINPPKVLVKSPVDKEIMIDFLSNYRTRDHIHNSAHYKYEQTKKYYPHGALFWFECNEYGEETGTAIFIKRVPDNTNTGHTDQGFTRLKQALTKTYTTKELFTKPFWTIPLESSGAKPKFFQYNTTNKS